MTGAPGPGAARLLLFATAALFSTGGAAIKACSLSGFQVASFRSLTAALFLAVVFPGVWRAGSWKPVAAGAAYAGTMVLFVLGNKLTTAASTIFLQSTAPLYVLLLSPWLLKERPSRRDIGLFVVMAAGLALCVAGPAGASGTAPNPAAGNILALLAGVCWAFTLMGLRWMAVGGEDRVDRSGGWRRPTPALSAVFWGNILAGVLVLPAALPAAGGGGDWLIVAYLGIFQIGLAYVLLTVAVRSVSALETSLFLLLEPVLNPIWAFLAHAEHPGAWTLAGGALILGGSAARAALESARGGKHG